MRKLTAPCGFVALLGILFVGCGGSSTASPVATIQAAVGKTTAADTAHWSGTIKGDSGILAKGITYEGGFDFRNHRAQLQLDPSGFGIPGFTQKIDAVFDYTQGAVIYMHIPQAATQLGKPWLKLDLNAAARAAGLDTDLNSVLQGQTTDPTSGLRFLRGAKQVTRVGSEAVRGTQTTHYRVTTDLEKTVAQSPSSSRDAMRELVDLYKVKELSADVWIDAQDRARRFAMTFDTAILKLPAKAVANPLSGKLTLQYEYYDFGTPLKIELPAPAQVADLQQLVKPR